MSPELSPRDGVPPRAVEQLKDYVQHKDDCESWRREIAVNAEGVEGERVGSCTCGLSALLTAAPLDLQRVIEKLRLVNKRSERGFASYEIIDECIALLTAAGQEVKMKDLESRMDSTSSSQQHIDAGENQPVPATVSDHQVSNEDDGRCQCGALLGTNMACWTCVSRIG